MNVGGKEYETKSNGAGCDAGHRAWGELMRPKLDRKSKFQKVPDLLDMSSSKT